MEVRSVAVQENRHAFLTGSPFGPPKYPASEIEYLPAEREIDHRPCQ